MFITSAFRLSLFIIAITASSVAVALWLMDGAWHYGSMPTKGVIRTLLFALAGSACLVLAGILSKHNPDKK